MRLFRAIGWAGFVSIVAVVSFISGVMIGLLGGSFNDTIDFCDDPSSPRYIQDEVDRERLCDLLKNPAPREVN